MGEVMMTINNIERGKYTVVRERTKWLPDENLLILCIHANQRK